MGDQFVVVDAPNGGVLVSNIKEYVPKTVVCQYFGPKISHGSQVEIYCEDYLMRSRCDPFFVPESI